MNVQIADPFVALAGAVVDEAGLLHLGEPVREQRELVSGRAVAPLGDRAVLSLTGVDRLSWLDSITSQSVAALAPGASTELLVLDPQGHVEHAAAAVDDGETTWLIVDRSHAGPLATWLTRMRFRLRVEIAQRDEVHVVCGTADAVAALSALAIWRDPWPGVSVGGWGYAGVDPHPGAQRDWVEAIVDAGEYARIAATAATGAQRIAGRLAADALRVA
ncbi:MAG: folate-binding protein, partial [Microbacterium sp.]